MYTFNLLQCDSIISNKCYSDGISMPSKLNIEECSINELKSKIAEKLSLSIDSFDVYYQGIQLTGDNRNFNVYDMDHEDNLLIVPKLKLPNALPNMNSTGQPSKSEIHQSSKTIEKLATPNEFHRLYWLMKTSDYWRRNSQTLPELLLDSSALGLSEDSVLFCQNFNAKRLTETIEANPFLFKVITQVIKEWSSNNNTVNSNDVQLSPAAYFLNGSPHLIEAVTPRQPAFNIMPRRITNEDFYRALEQTSRLSNTNASRQSTIPLQQTPRASNRRNIISMDQLRNALQRTTTTTDNHPSMPTTTTMGNVSNEPENAQELLAQMYAMGLTDEAANRQALEATNWDLKAALDLLLG